MRAARRHRLVIVMFLILAIVFSDCMPMQVHAETTLEKLEKAKQEKNKTENAKNSTQEQKNALQITQNSLLGKLGSLNDELATISGNLQDLEHQIEDKESEITNTQAELEQAIDTENKQYETMKLRIRFMYEKGDNTFLEMLLSASSFGDFLNKSDYIERLNRYDRKMLEQFKETRREVEETKARLETELEELNDMKEKANAEKGRVSGLVNQTANSVAEYADQIADAEETISTLENMISAQEQDIAALQKQYEKELELSRRASKAKWRNISEVTFAEDDRTLLANLIYCEAGGEPYDGKVAVGAVVINRVLCSQYPDTIVGVIYQKGQFEPVGTGRLALALASNKATASCYQAADEAMSGYTNVGQCVYFRTPIPGLTGQQIGGHIFY